MSPLRLTADVRRGVRDAAPILVGLVPFGIVAGVAAVDAGLSPVQTVGLSMFVFAGAAQLAAIDLLGEGARLAVVLLAAVVVNLRMLMYSASIAPYFRAFDRRWKAFCAYFLTDHAYALSLARYVRDRPDPPARLRYFLGVGLSAWVVWQASTLVGVVAGAEIPASLGLEFAVPLVFLALLVPTVRDSPTLAAALVGGFGAVLGSGLPYNLGLVGGAVAGVLAGVLTESRKRSRDGGDGRVGRS
jgi:4-azaleucine resistance transporter AzlC